MGDAVMISLMVGNDGSIRPFILGQEYFCVSLVSNDAAKDFKVCFL